MERRKPQKPKPAAFLMALSLFFSILLFILGFPCPASQGSPDVITTISPLNELKGAVGRDVAEAKKTQFQSAYSKLPLSFIQNDGQVNNKKVKFYENGSGRATFFTKDGVFLILTNGQNSSKSPSLQSELIKLIPINANRHPKIVAEGLQAGKVNYFIGNDPKKWKTSVPTYQAVVYQDVYPGIDLKFYGNNRQMEYDIVVEPGADPSKVKFAYEGIKGLRVTDEGNLEISLKGGAILQKKPIVYQELAGKRVKLDGKFKILEHKDPSLGVPFPISNQIGHGDNKARVVTFGYAIEVAQYDKNHSLIIDPVLVYSTYLGGINIDQGNGIAVDSSGNAYVTGVTNSTNFPTANALQAANGGGVDAFVAKLDAVGSALVYSTYLGGSDTDDGYGIAVDASGNAYVTGSTSSSNFPITPGAFQTTYGGAFVTKLDAAGSALIYSAYLGGGAQEAGLGIAVDGLGNAYVTGYTHSLNFPTVSPIQGTCGTCPLSGTAFVAKVNAAGSALVYSTYLGGSNVDSGNGIAVDSSGNAYVTGVTYSTNFPTANALQAANGGGSDAFVAKLNAAGSALIYSTYLGGNAQETGYSIVADASGNAYVTGSTSSTNFPTVNALQKIFNGGGVDAFVAKLDAAGLALIYSTYLGGNAQEIGYGIAADASGNAYVTGWTTSLNFPTASPLQAALAGTENAFMTKLNATGSALVYSTYLGGSDQDYSQGIAVDGSGNAYVTGFTVSTNFPTVNALQAANGGIGDAFVAKISQGTTTTTTSTTTTTTTNTTTTTVSIKPGDTGIVSIEAPDGILAGETREVEVQVKNFSKSTQTRSLSLTLNGVPVSGSPVSVTLTRNDTVTFNVLFEKPGIATLRARLSPADVNRANDTKTLIKIISSRPPR